MAAWRASAIAVLGPWLALVVVALACSVAAARVGAPFLHGGPWAWLGDAELVADALAALACLGVPAAIRRELVRRSGIDDVDAMSGAEFEARLAILFADLGYGVTATGARGDFGADLVLDGSGGRLVVQAKRYVGTVGIEAVQQVIGATRYYEAGRAIVVSKSTCTPAAAELATAHEVELVEREALVGLLAAHPVGEVRSGALSLLGREVAGGVTLLCFAVGRLLGVARWSMRLVLRVPFVLRRSRR